MNAQTTITSNPDVVLLTDEELAEIVGGGVPNVSDIVRNRTGMCKCGGAHN